MKTLQLLVWGSIMLLTHICSIAQESIDPDSLQLELTSGETNRLPFDTGIEVDGQYLSPGLWIRQSARYKKPVSDPSLYPGRYVYQIHDTEAMREVSGNSRVFLPKPFGRSLKTVINIENRTEVESYNERMLLEEQILLARRKQATYLNVQIGVATLGGPLG